MLGEDVVVVRAFSQRGAAGHAGEEDCWQYLGSIATANGSECPFLGIQSAIWFGSVTECRGSAEGTMNRAVPTHVTASIFLTTLPSGQRHEQCIASIRRYRHADMRRNNEAATASEAASHTAVTSDTTSCCREAELPGLSAIGQQTMEAVSAITSHLLAL